MYQTYLPCQTPDLLCHYREEELKNLRGNGTGELKEWDRVYDYAYYNDLGSPDKGPDHARPVLGGSEEYPYPRRGRTGRKPTKTGKENTNPKPLEIFYAVLDQQLDLYEHLSVTDPNSEKRLPLLSLDIYVPRDERFGHLKFSDFLAYALKSLVQVLLPELTSLCDKTINEFDTFEDVLRLYEGGLKLPSGHTLSKMRERIPWELLRELARTDGERFLKFPIPAVIKGIHSCGKEYK